MKANMLVVVILASVLAVTVTSAATVPVTIDWIKVNGDEFYPGDTIRYEIGEELDIRVSLNADNETDASDVQVEAYISGYRYSQYERSLISDVTRTFDLRAGTTTRKDLSLQIPMDWDSLVEDVLLRVRVSNRNDESFEHTFNMDLVGVDRRNAVQVTSFTVSPSSVVEQGRPLSFLLRVQNYGDRDLDDVYAQVSIPQLGIHDDEVLSELRRGRTDTFEELLIRVPPCTEPGTYTVEAHIEYDRYESTKETMTIRVVEGSVCDAMDSSQPASDRTVITVPESAEVVLGTTGGVYPIMISNLGKTAKTYTLTASGANAWGTVSFDPAAVVVVQPESVKTVYMYVSALENAQVGAQVFKVSVDSEGDSKQVVLTANIKESTVQADGSTLERGIFIGLIVLIVILIILGLIIGLSKIRGDKEDNDEETQTYY